MSSETRSWRRGWRRHPERVQHAVQIFHWGSVREGPAGARGKLAEGWFQPLDGLRRTPICLLPSLLDIGHSNQPSAIIPATDPDPPLCLHLQNHLVTSPERV